MAYFRNKKEIEFIPIPPSTEPQYVPPTPPTPPTPSSGSSETITPSHSGATACTIYVNTSDNNVVDKQLTPIISYNTITWLEDTSIMTPSIVVSKNTNIYVANYCYISDLGRYYYIDNIIMETGDTMRLNCKIDVLMTYKSYIRACSGVIKRNENNGNLYVMDNKFVVENRTDTKTLSFHKTPFTKSPNFLLTVSGGN